MKQEVQKFMESRMPLPGLVAWSARLHDRSVMSHCCTDGLSRPKIEQLLTRVSLAADSLTNHRIQALRLSWVFEHLRILMALRKDGGRLVLFVENRPGLSQTQLISALDDFVEMAGV